jgi:hypothetical protein
MAWRESIGNWVSRTAPLFIALLVLGMAAALVLFVPARGAAALLGILAGAIVCYILFSRAGNAVRIGALWTAIAVSADAAYARLNDQASVTLANALIKAVDAFVKLTEPLIRGLGLAATDPRAKVGAVAPDFVWAFILSLIVLMVIAFTFPPGRRR